MRGALLLLTLTSSPVLSFLWGGQVVPSWRYLNLPLGSPTSPGWRGVWREEVGGLVAEAPPQRMMVDWSNKVRVFHPNTTTSVGLMAERPKLSWPAEAGALYTVMVIDGGIQRVLPKAYVHWMVTNVPGNQVELGNEVMQYVTPFSLELDSDGNIIKDREQSSHPMILLAFRQPRRVVVEETQAGCSPDMVGARLLDYRDLVAKYSLELVAGNFLQVPWSGFHTQQMLCRVSRCTREPFPFAMPGVNDQAKCQPRTDIQDTTIVGPKLARRQAYSKYRSLLSLDSIAHQIQSLYPTHSTGRVKDYVALMGSYGAPMLTNNQATTLEGVVEVTFLEYPNKTQNRDLFLNAYEYMPGIEDLFETQSVAGGRPLKIVLSQPYDQDFDFMTALDKPGMVMEVMAVEVKEGRHEEFLELREKVIAQTRSSRNVKSMTKFDVQRDIMQEGDPLFFDLSTTELDILVFDSLAARRRAFVDLTMEEPNLLTDFFDTFICSACAVLNTDLHSTYYPPFD